MGEVIGLTAIDEPTRADDELLLAACAARRAGRSLAPVARRLGVDPADLAADCDAVFRVDAWMHGEIGT